MKIILPLSVKQFIFICIIILIIILILSKTGILTQTTESFNDTLTRTNNTTEVHEMPIDFEFESKGEKLCRAYLEKFFNKKFPKTRPNFLRNPQSDMNLELDCYCDELKLAVEYNGKQHYKFVPYFHKNISDFKKQCYRDQLKKRLCKENGIRLISVPYTVSYSNIPIFLYGSLLQFTNNTSDIT
jgi:hypothetical protein